MESYLAGKYIFCDISITAVESDYKPRKTGIQCYL